LLAIKQLGSATAKGSSRSKLLGKTSGGASLSKTFFLRLAGMIAAQRRLWEINAKIGNGPARKDRSSMAVYRVMSSVVINVADGMVLTPGMIVSDVGPGALLRPNYIPPGALEAMDADGALKVWLAGPISPTIDPFQPPPVTWWKAVPGTASPSRTYQLQGLGLGLPPVGGFS
jgi:hypothetical protein